MSGSMVFNWIQYHGTILALFVQCWHGTSFTACWDNKQGPTLTRTSQLRFSKFNWRAPTQADIIEF